MITHDEAVSRLRRHVGPWSHRYSAKPSPRQRLARQAGVSEAFLSQVVNGHKPLTDRLARAIGLQLVLGPRARARGRGRVRYFSDAMEAPTKN